MAREFIPDPTCKIENTSLALMEQIQRLEEVNSYKALKLSSYEKRAILILYERCQIFVREFNRLEK